HKVFLAESAKGLQYEVLKGKTANEVHVAPSLKRHRRAFRRALELYGADRGFFSEQNVTACRQGAVKTICIPQRSGTKTPQLRAYERAAAFKQSQRFRAGIEGRISVLMRGRGISVAVLKAPSASHCLSARGGARQQSQKPPHLILAC